MYERLRKNMVENYVIKAGIKDKKVILALQRIPRHLFVDPAIRHQAYQAGSLPIGFGQTISHPTTVALMSQLLKIEGGEKILEIGTGSGYQAAVLAEMGAKVYTIERIAGLGHQTRLLLEKLGYYSIAVRIGDGSLGWNEFAPYNRIIVTAGAPEIPDNLIRQLAEGGRMIIPVGKSDQQHLQVLDKVAGEIMLNHENSRNFVPLVGEKGWTE
jgi:protein-L-isoaspartate(D-aspartate) O-methyltransferase